MPAARGALVHTYAHFLPLMTPSPPPVYLCFPSLSLSHALSLALSLMFPCLPLIFLFLFLFIIHAVKSSLTAPLQERSLETSFRLRLLGHAAKHSKHVFLPNSKFYPIQSIPSAPDSYASNCNSYRFKGSCHLRTTRTQRQYLPLGGGEAGRTLSSGRVLAVARATGTAFL